MCIENSGFPAWSSSCEGDGSIGNTHPLTRDSYVSNKMIPVGLSPGLAGVDDNEAVVGTNRGMVQIVLKLL